MVSRTLLSKKASRSARRRQYAIGSSKLWPTVNLWPSAASAKSWFSIRNSRSTRRFVGSGSEPRSPPISASASFMSVSVMVLPLTLAITRSWAPEGWLATAAKTTVMRANATLRNQGLMLTFDPCCAGAPRPVGSHTGGISHSRGPRHSYDCVMGELWPGGPRCRRVRTGVGPFVDNAGIGPYLRMGPAGPVVRTAPLRAWFAIFPAPSLHLDRGLRASVGPVEQLST